MKKLVFLGYLPLSKKLWEDYFIDYMIEGGIAVEYWDLSKVIYPEIDSSHHPTDSIIRKLRDTSDLSERLKAESRTETLFLAQVTYEARSVPLFRMLKAYSCQTSFFARGNIPIPTAKEIASTRDNRGPLLARMIRVLKKVMDKVPHRYALFCKIIGITKTHDIVFKAGNTGMQTIGVGARLEKSRARIVDINFFDYDKYMTVRAEKENLVEGDYCVFLDEYTPYHPDFLLLGIPSVEPSKYYTSMNSFFKKLEAKFNTRVIIAAHPKADYKINPYDGRQLFVMKTCELVKNARFVISHSSTSISFAVLFNKPLIFIYNDEMLRLYADTYCEYSKHFAKTVGSKCYNIDTVTVSSIEISPVDIACYEAYRYDFLTSKTSENRTSKEIVLETLLNLNFD